MTLPGARVHDLMMRLWAVRQVAVSSLEMLDRQLDPSYISKSTLLPLLEVDLDLRNQAVVFMPPIAHSGPPLPDNTRRKSVRELVQAMLDSFLGVGCVFKRLDTGEGNYLREIQVRSLTCRWVCYEWRAEIWMCMLFSGRPGGGGAARVHQGTGGRGRKEGGRLPQGKDMPWAPNKHVSHT